MYYAITNADGRTLDSFHDEHDARRALLQMIEEEPDFASEGILIVHSDAGALLETLDFDDLRAEVVGRPAPVPFSVSSSRRPAGTAPVGRGLRLRWPLVGPAHTPRRLVA
jgi:hypothetical protein